MKAIPGAIAELTLNLDGDTTEGDDETTQELEILVHNEKYESAKTNIMSCQAQSM